MSAILREVRLLSDEPAGERRVGAFVIELGVPMPPRHQSRARSLVVALKAMNVGESFVHRTRVNTEAIRQVPGKKFAQRIVGKGPSYRVWRTG